MISEALIAKTVTLTLPFPVSVNGAFRRHNGKYLSERYRRWRDEAGWLLKQQKPDHIIGPVVIEIILKAPDRRRHDADNSLKAINDLLVAHQVIEDDDSRIIRDLRVRWIDIGDPGAVVTIRSVS